MKPVLSRLNFAAAVLALALAPCSALFAQDYEIRLDRPDPVGTRFHLSAVGNQSTVQLLKQGNKVIQDTNVKFTVEAELAVTVLAVSKKDHNTRVKLEVERLTRIEGDVKKELLPKGSVVTVSWDGKDQAFEMAGGALAPDTEESLKLLDLVTDDPDGPTDDEVLGTKDRKKVGDHWEGNAELMAKLVGKSGALVKKEDLKITTTLERVIMLDKTECMQLGTVITCDKFAPPLPLGLPVEKGVVKAVFSAKIPTAISLSEPGEYSTDWTTSVIARGKPDPDADEVLLQMTIEQSLSGRTTEIK
jgi:hypothetical protein